MSGAPRYETILKLASGGMATVWIGTVRGALGFRQLVAIKKPHPHLLQDAGFRGELVAEARLASMIRHANVVDVRDVEIDGDSISLVMDFIEGASLGELLVAASKRGGADARLPPRVAVRIVRDACAGLHAAHELVDERDRPVGLVHRDVSPQNVLVGTDGISRVTDFGVAKFARKHGQSTSEGSLKGKLAYMPPEYLRGEAIDRRFDVFAMGVVLWEALTGNRCFRGDNEAETLRRLLDVVPAPVSSFAPELEPLDAVVACALAKDRAERFQNAAAMGAALEGAAGAAGLLGGHTEVAATLNELVGQAIAERRALVRAKLAHEPSVASLMGLPAIDLTRAAPSTAPFGPPTTASPAATPKMAGAAARSATLASPSAVPSTQPMTPAMDASPATTPALNATPVMDGSPATTLNTPPVMDALRAATTALNASPAMAGSPATTALNASPAMAGSPATTALNASPAMAGSPAPTARNASSAMAAPPAMTTAPANGAAAAPSLNAAAAMASAVVPPTMSSPPMNVAARPGAPALSTLASAAPLAGRHPAIPTLHAAGVVAAPGASTLRSEETDRDLAAREPSAQHALAANAYAIEPPPKRSLVPLLAGAFLLATIGIGATVALTRSKPDRAETTAPSDTSAVAPEDPSSAKPASSLSASAAAEEPSAVAATSGSAPSVSTGAEALTTSAATAPPRATARVNGGRAPARTSGAPQTPAPAPSPTPTIKKPPANPYE
ncbi:MAG: protein kinase [Labilithrix sp.]|nr:protein kinase [Labilithrix sp.]